MAKLSSKAEATSTEGAPQMKKQKAQNYFNAMNRDEQSRERRFKAKHPKSKDAKDIKAFQRRDPASFSSFFTTVRCSFSCTAARDGALLRSRESGVATRGRRRLRRDATT